MGEVTLYAICTPSKLRVYDTYEPAICGGVEDDLGLVPFKVCNAPAAPVLEPQARHPEVATMSFMTHQVT
jgi:hypothetical protein